MTIGNVTVDKSYVVTTIDQVSVAKSYTIQRIENVTADTSYVIMTMGKATVDMSYVIRTIEKVTVDMSYVIGDWGSESVVRPHIGLENRFQLRLRCVRACEAACATSPPWLGPGLTRYKCRGRPYAPPQSTRGAACKVDPSGFTWLPVDSRCFPWLLVASHCFVLLAVRFPAANQC